MFKNKYLKQLQDVQAKIKECKKSIEVLDTPPVPDFKIGDDLYRWLGALFYGNINPVYTLYEKELDVADMPTLEYLNKLGTYFINVSDYYSQKKQYEAELRPLQAEEKRIKKTLGIE
jgi:hypothetical protein